MKKASKHPRHSLRHGYAQEQEKALKKKQLQLMRKRRRGETDDEEVEAKPVKKKLVLKNKGTKIEDKE